MIGQTGVLDIVLKKIANRVVNTLDIVACAIIFEHDRTLSERPVANSTSNSAAAIFAYSKKISCPRTPVLLQSGCEQTCALPLTHRVRYIHLQYFIQRNFPTTFLLPITLEEKLYGHLIIYDRQCALYVDAEEELIEEFCAQIILAIESQVLSKRLKNHSLPLRNDEKIIELYDSVNQLLFSVTIIAESLPDLWQQWRCERRQWLEQLRDATGSALSAIRALSQELNELES